MTTFKTAPLAATRKETDNLGEVDVPANVLWGAQEDVLLAEDHTSSGHKWRLVNNGPWKRGYVVFKAVAETQFVPETA